MKKLEALISLFFVFSLPLLAQETFTLTTYYPAPFGVYTELRSKRMAIGDTYYQQNVHPWRPAVAPTPGEEIPLDADLVVEGNVGIGTYEPDPQVMVEISRDAGPYGSGDYGKWGAIKLGVGRIDSYEKYYTYLGHNLYYEGSTFHYYGDGPAAQFNMGGWGVGSDSDFTFRTAPSGAKGAAATLTDVMKIKQNGNVGIGTTEPSTGEQPLKLDVEGAVGAKYYCDANGNNCVQPPLASTFQLTTIRTDSCLRNNSPNQVTAQCASGYRLLVCTGGCGDVGETGESCLTIPDYTTNKCTIYVTKPRCSVSDPTDPNYDGTVAVATCFKL